ncbi:hypothetical protein A6F49_00500 [Enteractinococcus helveticum]|uniref:Uncharacterized protein n=2 Tax=Enteractinococcus helveticum TaxID=1837282 RepID=A0A1B7LVM3_9MICC|nr:hypothetical protein A6F49_00500 [Enteractinococcus helveticum]
MAQLLLAGPRGRRFLLEYALASELERNPVRTDETFGQAVVYASYRMDPDEMTASAVFGWVTSDGQPFEVTVDEVAQRLKTLELLEPTPWRLRHAVGAAVDSARYWQEPEGTDILAATPEMLRELYRVAAHIAASTFIRWWCTPVDMSGQYAVRWEDTPLKTIPENVQETLLAARHQIHTEERWARVERGSDPTAGGSGEWWSHPCFTLPSSTRLLSDGLPAGLRFVEDSLGWEHADSVELIVPKGLRVFEIEDAADWASLCAQFPIEVTAQKRPEWYAVTGHTGRWVVPDWVQVAEHYDGIHLQVGAYLAAAGVAIPIDDSTDTASMIAGWNPDETYWFSSNINYDHQYTRWELRDAGTGMVWKPASPETS